MAPPSPTPNILPQLIPPETIVVPTCATLPSIAGTEPFMAPLIAVMNEPPAEIVLNTLIAPPTKLNAEPSPLKIGLATAEATIAPVKT